MAGNKTFTMIKPDAFAAGHSGAIIKMIEEAGYKIKAMKLTLLSPALAGKFYEIHKERPFYGELVDFMSSGPLIAMVLEKNNAVLDYRAFIGATNPANAAEGTVRKLYAKDTQNNAVHGSDSDENAEIESSFFFSQFETV